MSDLNLIELTKDELTLIDGGGFWFDFGIWLYDFCLELKEEILKDVAKDPCFEAGYNYIILNK